MTMGPGTTDATRLADEQAAVRRVANPVNDGAPPGELFAAVVSEVVRVLDVPRGWLFRFEPDRSVSVLASLKDPGFPVGSRIPLDGPSVAAMVLDTGRPARIDDYLALGGEVAARARESGVCSSVAVPILVGSAVWGLIGVAPTDEQPLPPDTDARLREFTELVAAAIASAESRDRLRGLADLQASLRPVATLVAEGAPVAELFRAVAEEVVAALDVDAMALFRLLTNPLHEVQPMTFLIRPGTPRYEKQLRARAFEAWRTASSLVHARCLTRFRLAEAA
jgi:GAF domain-containing protein